LSPFFFTDKKIGRSGRMVASLPGTFLRVRASPNAFELQTAVLPCTFSDPASKRTFNVSLVSTVHLAEPAYFAAIERSCADSDRVLFEMIVDEEDAVKDETGARRLRSTMRSSPDQRALGERYSLQPQVDALENSYLRPDWFLADLPRKEMGNIIEGQRLLVNLQEPLSNVLSGPTGRGSPLSRALILLLLPGPELALLLDDWLASGGAPLAQTLRALVEALVRLDFESARCLIFAQQLASGETTQRRTLAAEMLRARNARAVDEVALAVREQGCERISLLYGALHMRDMRTRLQERFELDTVGEPQWSTAWEIRTGAAAGASPLVGFVSLSMLTLLAVDWFGLWAQLSVGVVSSLAGAEAAGMATGEPPPSVVEESLNLALYIFRHGLLYVTLSSWAFDWESRWWQHDE
jgi:hypothetical protein